MPLFGLPDIKKLEKKRNLNGLHKALSYKKDWEVRMQAAQALGRIGDAHAVELLSAALRDSETLVRGDAAAAMGEIGDPRAVEPLVAAFKVTKGEARDAVAEALDKLGWQPDQDFWGAHFWISRRQWEKCVEIGAPSIIPLIGAINDNDMDVHKAASQTLVQVSDKRAVEPLISFLKLKPKPGNEHKDVRPPIIQALGQIGDQRAV